MIENINPQLADYISLQPIIITQITNHKVKSTLGLGYPYTPMPCPTYVWCDWLNERP